MDAFDLTEAEGFAHHRPTIVAPRRTSPNQEVSLLDLGFCFTNIKNILKLKEDFKKSYRI